MSCAMPAVLVHLFPDESAMNFYLAGLDNGLAGWSSSVAPGFSRLWITSGVSPIWGARLSSSANATQ